MCLFKGLSVVFITQNTTVIDLSESISHAFKQEKGSGHLSVCLRDYLE